MVNINANGIFLMGILAARAIYGICGINPSLANAKYINDLPSFINTFNIMRKWRIFDVPELLSSAVAKSPGE